MGVQFCSGWTGCGRLITLMASTSNAGSSAKRNALAGRPNSSWPRSLETKPQPTSLVANSVVGGNTGKNVVVYFTFIYSIAAITAAGCFGDTGWISASAWRNICLSLMIPCTGAILELLHVLTSDYSKDRLGTMASGPIMPISLVWYLYSNYLAANALLKYCTLMPNWLLAMAWTGLIGAGLDHVLETWQWFQGIYFDEHKARHKRFGYIWLKYKQQGGLLAPMCFAISSIIGICGVVFEILSTESSSAGTVALVLAIMLPTAYYEIGLSEEAHVNGGPSTVGFHLAHMLITHVGLSMMPTILVWLFRPDIDLFSWPF